MANQISSFGKADLMTYMSTNWSYIELYDETDTPVLRIPTSDARVTVQYPDPNGQVRMRLELKGDDVDVAALKPFKVKGSSIFKVATGGNPMASKNLSAIFNMQTDEDMLVVNHRIF